MNIKRTTDENAYHSIPRTRSQKKKAAILPRKRNYEGLAALITVGPS